MTHLQIPLKEPFRISGGEGRVKDAILVTVETGRRSASARARRWPRVRLFDRHPGGCWDDLPSRIAPSLLGRSFTTVEEIAALSADVDREPVRGRGGRDRALGPARTDPPCHHRRAARCLDRADRPGGRVGPGRRSLSHDRRADQDDREPLAGGYRRVKIKIAPGQRCRARPRGPPALRRHRADGRCQRRVYDRRYRRFPRAG